MKHEGSRTTQIVREKHATAGVRETAQTAHETREIVRTEKQRGHVSQICLCVFSQQVSLRVLGLRKAEKSW